MCVRILLIDAHDDARVSLARRLSREPRLEVVGSASSVDEAAGILSQARPDIVLLDIHAQAGRGAETCRGLHRLTEAPVIVLASYMTPELWAAAREAGAADYLLKQIDSDRLSREILRLAERHGRSTQRSVS